MKRLIEKGLMFGNLVEVSSPALVERYNRALMHLTGKTTDLPDFHIDISGYSPEIGDAFGDHLYLNPGGVNRQFILLTTAQKHAPLLGEKFSTSRPLLRRFIEQNEAELFALTTRDAVVGELANSVFDVSAPERLYDIRTVTVEADTTGAHVAGARKLAGLIDRFRTEDDAWWDDVLIAEMIELAQTTGDVTRHPIVLRPVSDAWGNFWTAHFGGLYVFRDVRHPATIAVGRKEDLGPLPTPFLFDLDDRNGIARFLELNDLVEPIVRARGVDVAALLGQKMNFILIDAATRAGIDIGGGTRRDLRSAARALGSELPAEFRALGDLIRWAEGGGAWPRISSEHPAYFYTLRARQGAERDLVNRLLSELTPRDARQLFICNKDGFYAAYRNWPEAKKDYVARYLEREYQQDKAGLRKALFGAAGPAPDPAPDLVDLVGPWGAVRRTAG